MKITEATTLAELEAYLTTLGRPFLTVMKTQQHGHNYHAIAYVLDAGAFNGGGGTIAEAIEDALASLRAAHGITNLAYEPLNYVTDRDLAQRLLDDSPSSRIGVSLREQTQRVLASLTPREREVLDQRLSQKALEREVSRARTATCIACGAEFTTFLPEAPSDTKFDSLRLCSACVKKER